MDGSARPEAAGPSPEVHQAICQWLFHEATLLDHGRFDEWLELLTEDIVYQAPVRVTRERGKPDISDAMFHFDDTRATLGMRVERLKTEYAWAEDPPSRTRHFVSNVQVWPTERSDELAVHSYVLVYRNRGSDAGYDLLSGERQDVLRQVDGRWRLARRRVVLDQATLGTKNLGIFL